MPPPADRTNPSQPPMNQDGLTLGPDRPDSFLAAGILVVERDNASAAILLRFLKSAGYRNAVSVVGSDAVIDFLYELNIDLLLIDSNLLISLDGTDVLDQIRRSHVHRHLPVIVLAADPDRPLRLRVLDQGANDILNKPVDAGEMALRIRNMLAAKAYRDLVIYRDDLTGLPNRERYTDRLDWAIRYSQRYNMLGAVLHIDLDRFKKVIEALGWATGDRMLRAVAKVLATCVRETDVVAQQDSHDQSVMLSRLSGNEFTVLLCGIDRPDSAAVVAQRILELVQMPLGIDGHELITTCSIGIAVFPSDGKTSNEIISAANIAMHDVKRTGGNGFRFFSHTFNERAIHRLSLEADLRHALDGDQLALAYQPKIDIATGAICGAEALLRWQHPQRGLVTPVEFIPVAEESGLIHQIGDRVVDLACRQIRLWLDAGIEPYRIALNISSSQFSRKHFVEDLAGTLAKHGIDGRRIVIEITESLIMDNIQGHLKTLTTLRSLGIELSVDDFGTGYSSLAYLKRLPLHELKIDRSFLTTINTDDDSAAIVTAIVSMGHQLGLKIVAEGVETQQQLEFLRAHHCDTYQGFLFSPAVSPERFAALLAAGIATGR